MIAELNTLKTKPNIIYSNFHMHLNIIKVFF